MKTQDEVKKIFCEAVESEDGHFYDADECWYCGYISGVQISMLWFLGLADIYQINEDGSRRLKGKRKVNTHEYFRELKGI